MYKRYIGFLIVIFMIALICDCYSKYSMKTDTIEVNKITKDLEGRLKSYNYVDPVDNEKSLYIISNENGILNFKKYIIKNNDKINIEINNKPIIMSLLANSTMDVKWNIENKNAFKNVEFQDEKWLTIFSKPIPKGSTGISFDRQFFYFNIKNQGSEVISFYYKHNKRDEIYFQFQVNLRISIKE